MPTATQALKTINEEAWRFVSPRLKKQLVAFLQFTSTGLRRSGSNFLFRRDAEIDESLLYMFDLILIEMIFNVR